MITITYQDALGALRAAVEEKGEDYVYKHVSGEYGASCVYRTADGQPSCIVGNVLVRLGVPVEDLPSPHGLQVNAKALLKKLPYENGTRLRGVDATFSAAQLLDDVQVLQDEGAPWGQAVELAVMEVPDGDS